MILLLCRLSVDYLTCPLVEFVSSLWVCCYMFFLLWLRYFLFIYLFYFFFLPDVQEKKKSLSDILKLTINGLDLSLSTPTQPNPHLLLHPSIHPCFTRGTQVLSLCFKKEKWASSVFFLPFMTVFSKNTIFFQEPSPLSLFLSLVWCRAYLRQPIGPIKTFAGCASDQSWSSWLDARSRGADGGS